MLLKNRSLDAVEANKDSVNLYYEISVLASEETDICHYIKSSNEYNFTSSKESNLYTSVCLSSVLKYSGLQSSNLIICYGNVAQLCVVGISLAWMDFYLLNLFVRTIG
jgi:hypothetical protein